jgi:carbonic anhydrase
MKATKRSALYAAAVSLGLSGGALASGDHGGTGHDEMAEKQEAAHAKPHWSYSGEEGPVNWGGLATEFKTCAAGKNQSPIDISTATVTSLSDISITYSDTPVNVVNNGHTIQVNYGEGSKIKVGDKEFDLLQFHFHSPTEHTVGGKSYPMEAHLVHKAADGQLGVVGIMIRPGEENATLAKFWDNLPAEAGKTFEASDSTVNVAELLPGDLTYFNYSGSLTTPPCSEGVNWMVLTTPIEASEEQIAKFSGMFPNSNRPVQPINGRVVRLDN